MNGLFIILIKNVALNESETVFQKKAKVSYAPTLITQYGKAESA